MNYEEIIKYFESNPPPETVDWKPWAKITNTRGFIAHSIILIKGHKGKIDDCPAWWRLKEFYQDMKKLKEQQD